MSPSPTNRAVSPSRRPSTAVPAASKRNARAPTPGSAARGRLFVIAAPSGAGKTSLVQALLQRKPELHVSISYTTRRRRPTEEDGREYHFISLVDFWALEKQGQFLEYAQVFDNFYGTGRRPVESELARGHHVVLEIDWQGARQVRKAMPECVTIFVLPPSRQALEQRLRTRATDSEEVIARRLQDAVSDMSHWDEFDYVIVNDEFDHAVGDLVRIIEHQERAATDPTPGLASQQDLDPPLQPQRPELQALLAELLA